MSEEIEIMVSTVNAVVYIEIWTLLFSLHKEKTAIKSSIIDFFFSNKKNESFIIEYYFRPISKK